MATNQDKMQTDYLWIRNNPNADSTPLSRTHGYNYLYYHAPNKRERLEMIWRSMGKQHDWELEKFRIREIKKDFSKMLSDSLNTLWVISIGKLINLDKLKEAVTCLGIGFGLMIVKYKMMSMNTAKKNNALLLAGKNIEGSATNYMGYHDNQMAQMSTPLTQWLYHQIPGHKIVVNPCRNQNYRKYFELKKRSSSTE